MGQYAFWFLVLFAIVVCVILFGQSATIALLASILDFFSLVMEKILIPSAPWIIGGIVLFYVIVWLISRHMDSKLEQDDYHVNTPQSGKRKQKKVTHKEPSNKTGQRSGKKNFLQKDEWSEGKWIFKEKEKNDSSEA